MKKKPTFSAIAALGKNGQIGINGHLPWNLPEEYAHYKSIVKNQYVLIGRKNFEANNEDFKDSTPIVLTRNPNFKNTVQHFSDIEGVIKWASDKKIDKIFVIGGSEIYKLSLPYLSEFHLSRVDYDGKADTFFPPFENYSWNKLVEQKFPDWTYQLLIKEPKV